LSRRWITTAILLALSACSAAPSGKTYAIDIDTARSRLHSIDMPLVVFGSTALKQSESAIGADRIVWQIEDVDGPVFEIGADLQSEKQNETKITVDFHGATQGPNAGVEKKLSEKPAIREFYRKAMEERIAAAIEGRHFEFTRTLQPMMVAAFVNMKDLNARFDTAAKAHNQMMKENFDQAYAKESGQH
jgi:hypothetical protein